MGFFSKKSSSVKGKEAPLADYGSAQDDADLPVAHVVGVPMGFAPSATLSPATVPPATAPSGPMITNIQEKTARTQQQGNIAKIILTRFPTQMDHCPCCQANSRTRVVTFPNWVTWSLCALLFFVFWPLCWVPLVVEKVRALI